MQMQVGPDCTIRYTPQKVELVGDDGAIHQEARRIMRRFAATATPYRIVSDSRHRVLMRTVH